MQTLFLRIILYDEPKPVFRLAHYKVNSITCTLLDIIASVSPLHRLLVVVVGVTTLEFYFCFYYLQSHYISY